MSIKTAIQKMAALMCIAGVVALTNIPLVSAYEAYVMNVTANIVDDSVSISPSGEKFCNDGKLKVELKTALEGAKIYYTTDGSDPVCEKNGTLYSESFTLAESKVVKAVSCHDGAQSLVMSRSYQVSQEYCDNTSIKVNKVYYNPDKAHMSGTCNNENEWVELYNPTAAKINVKGWKICNGTACDNLSSCKDLWIPAKGYAVVTDKATTWSFWNVPDSVIKLSLNNAIGGGLNNSADTVAIKDASGKVIDEMSWGGAAGLAVPGEGKIFGRITNGYDTDKNSDWTTYSLPTVSVTAPNAEETWKIGSIQNIKWAALNSTGGCNSALSVDLYYSIDDGKTWVDIVKDTKNDGAYEWRVPLAVLNGSSGESISSTKVKIKAVVTDYTRNFMLSSWDINYRNFCHTVDVSLLTPQEYEALKTMNTDGLTIINSSDSSDKKDASLVAAEVDKAKSTTADNTDKNAADTSSQVKSSEMLGKDDEDYLLNENDENKEAKDKDDKDADVKVATEAAAENVSEKPVTEAAALSETAKASEETAKSGVEEKANNTTTAKESVQAKDSVISSKDESQKAGTSVQSSAVGAVSESAIAPDKDAAIEFNLNS